MVRCTNFFYLIFHKLFLLSLSYLRMLSNELSFKAELNKKFGLKTSKKWPGAPVIDTSHLYTKNPLPGVDTKTDPIQLFEKATNPIQVFWRVHRRCTKRTGYCQKITVIFQEFIFFFDEKILFFRETQIFCKNNSKMNIKRTVGSFL